MPDVNEPAEVPVAPPPLPSAELLNARVNALYIEVRRLLDLRSDMPEKARLVALFEGI